eukprot:scaffold198398_cov23-Prasinocladus_malaysianus.AAC.1
MYLQNKSDVVGHREAQVSSGHSETGRQSIGSNCTVNRVPDARRHRGRQSVEITWSKSETEVSLVMRISDSLHGHCFASLRESLDTLSRELIQFRRYCKVSAIWGQSFQQHGSRPRQHWPTPANKSWAPFAFPGSKSTPSKKSFLCSCRQQICFQGNAYAAEIWTCWKV